MILRMRRRNIATLLFLAVSFLNPRLIIAESVKNTITRQNQADQNCDLTVDVDDKGNWINLIVSIPKDDKRLERLHSIRFVLGTNGSPWPWEVIVPIRVPETLNGAKRFQVSVQKSHLHDSFIEFICRWANPRLSSEDICYLKLESYVDDKGRN